MNEYCINHSECKRKREKWKQLQSIYCSKGQKELDNYLDNIQDGKHKVLFDKHFHKRSLERSITQHDVKEVLHYGWVIERNQTPKATSVVLLGYVGKHYRALHVVFDMISPDTWVAVTAYDPNSHSWKWNDGFNKRICFCNHEEN